MRSSIHNKDFLLERGSKAHSCPARALPGCSGGVGGLCGTPEGRGGNTPAAGEQRQRRWPQAIPLGCGLQGGARTGESPGPSVGRAVQRNGGPGRASGPWSRGRGCAGTRRASLRPSRKPEPRSSKVIIKLLLLFPSLAAISMPRPLGNTA